MLRIWLNKLVTIKVIGTIIWIANDNQIFKLDWGRKLLNFKR